jgi:hypothetical protein
LNYAAIGYDWNVNHIAWMWPVIAMVGAAAVALTVKYLVRVDRRQRYFIEVGTLSERWLAEQRGESTHADH